MASQWIFVLFGGLLVSELCHAYITTHNTQDCQSLDNHTHFSKDFQKRCGWILRFERNLVKYSYFTANLLLEENQNFAVELQELFNIFSLAQKEPDDIKQAMLYYAAWLVEQTKNFEEFLTSKGIRNI